MAMPIGMMRKTGKGGLSLIDAANNMLTVSVSEGVD